MISDRIVLNVDVASTVAQAAGARMRTDGLDMLGTATRGGFVLEAMAGYNDRPAYCGFRTKNRMYVRWATGEVELYDYRSDPAEQHNLARLPGWAHVRKVMKARAMVACTPVPPHYSWTKKAPQLRTLHPITPAGTVTPGSGSAASGAAGSSSENSEVFPIIR